MFVLQALVEACRQRYESSRDASLLPPALGGMPKEEITPLLPRVLEPASLFDAALDRILLPLPSGLQIMPPMWCKYCLCILSEGCSDGSVRMVLYFVIHIQRFCGGQTRLCLHIHE